ncbi:MAG: acetyl-CoA hydrolase [Bdellovibrionales bacterium]|nr:acetyl-CoA hydrolase [Bdellovibrionales bacterium]
MWLLNDLKSAEDLIFSQLGKEIRLATPLGLGKPNQLLNQIYNHAKKDASISLTIFTALSLDMPDPKSDLESRFVEPFYERHFGKNYPRLDYLRDLHSKSVPSNIRLHEFYFQAGSQLKIPLAQQNYISLNYTHVTRAIFEMEINVIVQLVALSPDGQRCSLSCNPDLTLDLRDLYKQQGKKLLLIGVVHPDLPFLGGDAEVGLDFFDAIVKTPEVKDKLFAVPKAPVTPVDYLIGLHASRLIPDDGTLQIGIGSLSDALVYATLLRHGKNELYRELLQSLDQGGASPQGVEIFSDIFHHGIYGTSEMLMDGFMNLRRGGVLKRLIFDHDEKARRYLHGAFYLGSAEFYEWLRGLKGEDYDGLSMTRVSKVNDLYDVHELALRRQRKRARFFNTCMQVSLLGGAASETLENGGVVSGVGGQYNFVAMSHELPDSHSVLMLKSFRKEGRKRASNIIWSPAHLTIPRHLRDVVVTEYGIAALKGQSDEVCIQRLLMIADSEFQEELLDQAKSFGKVSSNWQLPAEARHNHPDRILKFTRSYQGQGLFTEFPFGSDFTPVEERLQAGLLRLKTQTLVELIQSLIKGFSVNGSEFREELERMKLQSPKSLQERVFRRLLLSSLQSRKAFD